MTKKREGVKSLQIRGNSYHAKIQELRRFYEKTNKAYIAVSNAAMLKYLIDSESARIENLKN